jgi:hypothetical protein
VTKTVHQDAVCVPRVDQLRAGFVSRTGHKRETCKALAFSTLVRDQEVEGSNPFAPTISFRSGPHTDLGCNYSLHFIFQDLSRLVD